MVHMTTRRSRLESKLARRQSWAEGHKSAASSLFTQNEPYRGDIAFNTQPGHIPEVGEGAVLAADDAGTPKPAKEILDALKGAGFRWGQGMWSGKRSMLPEQVTALLQR